MKALTLLTLIALVGCGGGSMSAPKIQTDLTAKPWTLTLTEQNNTGSLGTLTFSLPQSAQCGSVQGPACFGATNLQSSGSSVSGVPTSLVVGVLVNPVPDGAGGAYGAGFAFQYVYATSGSGTWTISGSGQFYQNGNIAGSWTCDCGLTGNFTAGQT